ncbi:MAG: hypothetical protein ACFFHV_01605 [Promethearchaeota archaeon]
MADDYLIIAYLNLTISIIWIIGFFYWNWRQNKTIKDLTLRLSLKKSLFSHFYEILKDILNEMLLSFKEKVDNSNYLYYKNSYTDIFQLRKANRFLTKIYAEIGYLKTYQEIREFESKNSIRFIGSGIRIEAGVISIHRSWEDFLTNPDNPEIVISDILMEVKQMAKENGIYIRN